MLMSKIAIIGAGRVGTAAAKILLTVSDCDIAFVDSSEPALATAYLACAELQRPTHRVAFSPDVPVEIFAASGDDALEATIRAIAPDIVLCATPFSMNIVVATIANAVGAHYIDFTEDNAVTAAINRLELTDGVTFVPQTGLAPGLVNYIGLSLFDDLGEPDRLDLRVGALPQVSFGPAHYAVTWSVEGLVNEYIKDAFVKIDGAIQTGPSLDEHELLIVNGVQYEGFTTAGGVGDIKAYEHVPSVQYKTLRFPGHLEFLQKMFSKRDEEEFEKLVQRAKAAFNTTRDDVVVLVAHAVDKNGRAASAGLHFYPSEELGLTALELTTAGVGVGVVELLLANELPTGALHCGQIPFDKLLQTASLRMVFDHMN